MENLFIIILSAIFVNNFVLTRFLGLCPFFGVSKKTWPAVSMGLAVTFVMTLASFVTWIVYQYFLVPFNVEFLKIIVFILVIASFVQFVEIIIKRYSEKLYKSLGIYLPLITTNCAVLGVAFLNVDMSYSFIAAIVHGLSAGIGFLLALLLMSGIRERLEYCDVPKSLKGLPVSFIVAFMLALSFTAFNGLLS